jgi:hypothetical protein
LSSLIVDTNVGVVANEREAHASPECVIACVDALERIVAGRARLVLDDGWEILKEYMRYMSSSGQPGPGDAFVKWALNNLANPDRCECVPLDMGVFPIDPDLAAFDPADRKFVALALASDSRPAIANAVDSDWWHFREALQRAGVEVIFLCPDRVTAWEQRSRRSRT